MIIVKTVADVVVELKGTYRQFLSRKDKQIKKGERSKKFLGIIRDLFGKYGARLGYNNFPDFKSDVINAAKNNKKSSNITKSKPKAMPVPKQIPLSVNLPSKKVLLLQPNEGSGAAFTAWQIANLGLNEDSY